MIRLLVVFTLLSIRKTPPNPRPPRRRFSNKVVSLV